jgi:hypothetical protein
MKRMIFLNVITACCFFSNMNAMEQPGSLTMESSSNSREHTGISSLWCATELGRGFVENNRKCVGETTACCGVFGLASSPLAGSAIITSIPTAYGAFLGLSTTTVGLIFFSSVIGTGLNLANDKKDS